MSDNHFYILSIDGGGFRGLFSAHLLKRMEEAWNIDWLARFGMLAGTSTGSILAAGLACGLTGAALTEFYRLHGRAIFRPRLASRMDLLKILSSRYSSKTLRTLLDTVMNGRKLGDITVPLILPAVDIGNGCVHVFKSCYSNGFVRDAGVKVADAVLASCSAPTYFDPHTVNGTYQLVDGGLWANNPALVAVIDAHYRLGVPLANIRVLSIGTGRSSAFYPRSSSWWKDWFVHSWQGWGFATRWQRSKLLDLILNLQADNAHNTVCLLLGESPLEPKSVCRLTFESDQCLPMDSTRKAHDWISKADLVFTHNAHRIAQFLSISGVKQCVMTATASI